MRAKQKAFLDSLEFDGFRIPVSAAFEGGYGTDGERAVWAHDVNKAIFDWASKANTDDYCPIISVKKTSWSW